MPETIKCHYCQNIFFDVQDGKCPFCKYPNHADLGMLMPLFDELSTYDGEEDV